MKILHVFTLSGTAWFFDGQFKFLKEHGYDIVMAAQPLGEVNDFAARNGIKFIPVEIPRSVSPLAIMKAIGAIRKIIKDERPKAVFGHTPVGALVAMIAASLEGVHNRVYYRHGLIYTTMHGLNRFLFKTEERFVSLLATKIINVSHSLSRLAVREHLNSERKQIVIGRGTCGGIDAKDKFNPTLIAQDKLQSLRRHYSLDETELIFGFCGRIVNDKGIPELVDGFELFQTKHPDLTSKLVLVGCFDSRDGVSDIVRNKLENNKNIITTGQVAKSDIPLYYSLFDVFVFPSHREGFGMCVVEASAMEKPILVSHVHGCEDSIIENETGLYIPLDAVGICEGMEKMRDAEMRERFGKAGRKMVLEFYDKRVMWPIVKDVYDKILNQ